MQPEQWEKVKEVFSAATELPAAERATFLAESCGADAALRGEVESLLAAHEEPKNVLEQHPYDLASQLADTGQQISRQTLRRLQYLARDWTRRHGLGISGRTRRRRIRTASRFEDHSANFRRSRTGTTLSPRTPNPRLAESSEHCQVDRWRCFRNW